MDPHDADLPDPADAAEFDARIFAELRFHIGAARLDDVLARFAAALPARFAAGVPGPDTVRAWTSDAHVVVSVAGMAGLVGLARRCRALEGAVPGSPEFLDCLAAVRAARDDAGSRIAALRRALAAEGCTAPGAA